MVTRADMHDGDMRQVLLGFDPGSFDAIVTDPPYGLAFMGSHWDQAVPGLEYWHALLRVAKPGAHLVAFGGTRTFHRLMCAVEDAGWELRDTLLWLYGSGFPKSENLSGEWEGWGSGLKPAWEPIILARKPPAGSIADNMREHGVGALNIDGCRIPLDDGDSVAAGGTGTIPCRNDPQQLRTPPTDGDRYRRNCSGDRGHGTTRSRDQLGATDISAGGGRAAAGRWPANVCHDGSPEVLAGFPAQAGAQAPVHKRNGDKFRTAYGAFGGNIDEAGSTFRGDSGSAARFFYCPKASRRDRNEGCEHLAAQPLTWSSGEANPGAFQSEGTDRTSPNFHPTVKPTELMRWLVRMVAPPGSLVLDPFAGSGSTGKACVLEGVGFVGVERERVFGDIARARIAWAQRALL